MKLTLTIEDHEVEKILRQRFAEVTGFTATGSGLKLFATKQWSGNPEYRSPVNVRAVYEVDVPWDFKRP